MSVNEVLKAKLANTKLKIYEMNKDIMGDLLHLSVIFHNTMDAIYWDHPIKITEDILDKIEGLSYSISNKTKSAIENKKEIERNDNQH